jgi:hypothetical protein
LASDESLARSLLNFRFRNLLKEVSDRDLLLEVGNDQLLIGNKKKFDYGFTIRNGKAFR